MSRAATLGLTALVALAAGTAGYLAQQRGGAAAPSSAASGPQIGDTQLAARDRLLALTLPDAAGRPQALAQWKGRILVVNFWATWCPPCIKEIPEFSRASRRFAAQGVQFVGLGIDSPEAVRRFQQQHDVPYPLLIGSHEVVQLTSTLGNAALGLPYTLILDRDGSIRLMKLGTLSEADLAKQLAALGVS